MTTTDAAEVHAIVGKILETVGVQVSCSDEVLIAAFRIAATTVEETKSAHFGAQLRAGLVAQYRNRGGRT